MPHILTVFRGTLPRRLSNSTVEILEDLGVEIRTSARVTKVTEKCVTLPSGEPISRLSARNDGN